MNQYIDLELSYTVHTVAYHWAVRLPREDSSPGHTDVCSRFMAFLTGLLPSQNK